MIPAPLPADEPARLASLRALAVLDSAPEAEFDALVQATASSCGVPIACISLVDAQRQWFKATTGLPGLAETPRDLAFCSHTILGDGILEVRDARLDARFAKLPLVSGPAAIRFYAGVAVRLHDGQAIGALCVLDRVSRSLSAAQGATLISLAKVAGQLLEGRRALLGGQAPGTESPRGPLCVQPGQDAIAGASSSQNRHGFAPTPAGDGERALLRLTQEQSAILDSELFGACKIRNGEIHWTNHGLENLLGYDRGELTGCSATRLFPARGSDPSLCESAYPVLLQGDSYRSEILLRRKDGSGIWAAVSGKLLDAASKEMLWMAFDISARKQAEHALRQSQSLLERTGQIAGIGGWELDLRSRVFSWSEHTHALLEAPPDYQPSLTASYALFDRKAMPVLRAAAEAAVREGKPIDLELPLRTLGGRNFWARIVGSAERQDGIPVRLVGAFQDISARHDIEQELAAAYELQRVTLDSIGDAVITTDRYGTVEWLNPVAENLTGWNKLEAQGQPLSRIFRIVHEATRETAEDPVARCLHEGRAVGLANQAVLISRDDREYGIEDSAAPIRNRQGEILGAVLVFHDVSEARRLAQEMSHRARHDPLTGLVNRTEFETRLDRLLAGIKDGDQGRHAVMYIDLDQFKVVNDTCGHAVGDQLLRQVSTLLKDSIRSRDTLARLGGDEFGMILEHCSADQAMQICKKICEQMEVYRFVHQDHRFRIGASIGLVEMDGSWPSIAALQQAADSACYRAKDEGRNRVHRLQNTDRLILARQGEIHWVNRLEQAMDEDQFVLFGQRIVPLKGADSGLHCEVLLRLQDADGGLVPPSVFIPAAERYHLAGRLDRWVVRQVFRKLQALGGQLDTVEMISINLSGKSIGDRAFHRHLIQLIREAGFDVRKLCFEITETAAITNFVDARPFVEELRTLGVHVALDDFGAGASSFAYLKSLPVDFLKIDGQFITSLLEDPLDQTAVECFQQVARVVGVRTIAEFVEREDVRARLVEIGIDFAQGYLVHRPEPLQELLADPGPC